MRFVGATDQKIRIQDVGIKEFDLIRLDRVHVVNEDTTVDRITFKTQIAAIIARNDLISDPFPLHGLVKTLVQITIESKSLVSDPTADSQVIVTIFYGVEKNKRVIALYHFYYSHMTAWRQALACRALQHAQKKPKPLSLPSTARFPWRASPFRASRESFRALGSA